ncbi:IclR family transcriptional regulator [Acuticoccus kandeliae]|uniref:IclR family transcriptional regulator n=1 Tax=Acuticoccus kandeliae TaxID=2073160 RepID=UPI000D3E82CA|nr:IclR family transcriptional regulator [Acuticoccus kandeliae]
MADEAGPSAKPGVYTSQLRQDGNRWLLTAQDRELPKAEAPGLVPALENAIAVIDYINRTPPHIASLAEISSTLGISKSHCHNILKTLVHFGWLKFDNRAKTYELSSGIIAAASSFHGSHTLARIRAELEQLVHRIEVPAVLAQPQTDDSFIVVDKFNGPQSMEVSFPIGHHLPRDSVANSRAFIAWQPPERIDEWMRHWQPVRYTNATLLTEQEVRAEFAATRARGYARSIGELTDGLMALGMPIFDRNGEVIYVFTCSGHIGNLAPREEKLAREIIRTAVSINSAILARTPPDFPMSMAVTTMP